MEFLQPVWIIFLKSFLYLEEAQHRNEKLFKVALYISPFFYLLYDLTEGGGRGRVQSDTLNLP
jgi:hypothetical protein